jgi:hypothetical protein
VGNSIGNLFDRLLKRDNQESAPAPEASAQTPSDARRQERTDIPGTARIEWLDDDGVCHKQPVALRDSSTKGVSFSAPEEFPVDQTLWIETEPDKIKKAIVRHCLERAGSYVTGAYLVDQERRRLDRFPASGRAVLHWGDPQMGSSETPVFVRNATEFGFQIESKVPLPVGTIVQLCGDELQCDGATCYCREQNGLFVIGIHMVREAYAKNSLDYRGD